MIQLSLNQHILIRPSKSHIFIQAQTYTIVKKKKNFERKKLLDIFHSYNLPHVPKFYNFNKILKESN